MSSSRNPEHPDSSSEAAGDIESPVVHVVAALMEDASGRVLLSRRNEGGDFAGRWEFPGGKREPGEASEDALRRELAEELGIEAGASESLISVPCAYPHRRIVLEVRRLLSWHGQPRGKEAQALAWVPRERLGRYQMPDADLPVIAAIEQPARYRISPSDPITVAYERFMREAQRSWRASGDRLCLRLPGVDAVHVEPVLQQLLERLGVNRDECAQRIVIARHADLARRYGIGLHLSAGQLGELGARPEGISRMLASCHDESELIRAAQFGMEAVVLGPVEQTASHPGQPGIGWNAFRAMRERSALPIYAIGGLGPGDVELARSHGAQGVAGISGFLSGD